MRGIKTLPNRTTGMMWKTSPLVLFCYSPVNVESHTHGYLILLWFASGFHAYVKNCGFTDTKIPRKESLEL